MINAEGVMNMSMIYLNIVRGNAGQEKRFESFEVPFREGMSVLDAIFWLREHKDPSIAVRYSCRSANACKECSAIVDGKPGFLCSIRAVPEERITVEPLPAKTWIKDLVTTLD
jgi:succinate dehydrogenase/fumarate reductase-like Fe-S protein